MVEAAEVSISPRDQASGFATFSLDADVGQTGCVAAFSSVPQRLGERFAPEVVAAVSKALTVMEDGKPCLASQVAPGRFSIAALAATALVRIVAGQSVSTAPELMVVDMPTALCGNGIALMAGRQ